MRIDKKEITKLIRLALLVKKDILEISFKAKVGHIGSSISIADILTVLYLHTLKVNPKKPYDSKRDRFILSKGHAAAALYCVLHKKGFFGKDKLLTFCAEGGVFGSHPVHDIKLGIELSTGSLGHGLSVGAGLALGLKKNNGIKIPRVFVMLSDAEMNEGSVWEAVMFAAHHNLDNLIAIVDDNNYQAFGKAQDVIKMQPLDKRFSSFDWVSKVIDGHNIQEIINSFDSLPFRKNAPSVIIAKTKTAKGISFLENKQEAHYFPLSEEQYKKAVDDIERQSLSR